MTQPAGPIAALLPPDPSTAPLPALNEERIYRDVIYRALPGYRPLALDLYLPPAAPTPAPGVLFLHGGGWLRGSRHTFGPAFDWTPSPFQRLAAAGFVVASVDYRLSAEALFPAQLDDVKAALGWLRGRAGELALDPARIAAWGESAGGHLAALLALAPEAQVTAVVDWYGPSDLLTLAEQAPSNSIANPNDPGSREALLIGGLPREHPAAARAASPAAHVHAGAPPFLIAHGTADRFVPYGQSAQLAEALQSVGADARLVSVEGADHMWSGTDPEPLFTDAIAFLQELL